MAYQGPELATMALISRLNSSLATELAAIKAERGDSFDVPTPDRWTDERQTSVICNTAQIEVFEERGSFPHVGREWSSWDGTAAALVTTDCALVVLISWLMRSGESRAEMHRIGRRYLQALVRICRDYPDLGGQVQHVMPTGWDLRPVEGASEDGTRTKLGQLKLELTIQVSETAADEGGAGTAPPVSPGATLT